MDSGWGMPQRYSLFFCPRGQIWKRHCTQDAGWRKPIVGSRPTAGTMRIEPNGIGAALRMQFRRRSKGSTPFMRTTCWTGEMVDTGASNTPAEMHEGSTPSSSTMPS